MSLLADRLNDVTRLREILGVLSRHGFGQFLERVNLGRFIPGKVAVPADQSQEASAARLLLAFQELGPSFIKFGQILSTRADVLPLAYVKALQTLQDRVPPFPFDEVRKSIETEFGRPLEEVYAKFEPTPIASASIGQVHRAWDQDGRKFAVKVKRPDIDDMIQSDINLLYGVARLVESVIDLNLGLTPTEIVTDFERSMKMELDFVHEANNAKLFTANFRSKPYIRFPEPIDALSGRTVLTMIFIEAVKISEANSWPADRRKLVIDRLVDAGVQMVLDDGFFHGDPHPGNLFVDNDCNVTFLDVGLAGSVPKYLMEGLLQMAVSAAMKDSASVARLICKIGAADHRVNLSDLKNDIDALLDKYLKINLGQMPAAELIAELFERGSKYGIKFPPEIASMIKALLNIEGLVRMLYPEMDVLEVAKPYAAKYFKQRISFESIQPELLKRGNELLNMMTDMPLQFSQLMLDLERGRFSVVVNSPDIRDLQKAIRSLAVTAFGGMIAAAFLIGGFSIVASSDLGHHAKWWALAAFASGTLAGIGAFGWHFIAIRLRRPNLKDFTRKR